MARSSDVSEFNHFPFSQFPFHQFNKEECDIILTICDIISLNVVYCGNKGKLSNYFSASA